MFKIEQKKRESGKNKEKIWLQLRAHNVIFLHETYASTWKNLWFFGEGGVALSYLYDALSAAIRSLTTPVSKYTVFIYCGLGENFLAVNSECNQTRLSHSYYNLPVDGFNIPFT